jgi:hypothetical protein
MTEQPAIGGNILACDPSHDGPLVVREPGRRRPSRCPAPVLPRA